MKGCRKSVLSVVVMAGCFMPFGLAAQDSEFARTVKQCEENGFSHEACVAHAEKVLQSTDSYDRQYMDDRRRRLQAQQERKAVRPSGRTSRPQRSR